MARFGLGTAGPTASRPSRAGSGCRTASAGRCSRRADLLINVSGTLRRPEDYRRDPRLAYIDSDPVFTQVKLGCRAASASSSAASPRTTCTSASASGCRGGAPATPFRWRPTRQPVVLSEWGAADGPPRRVHDRDELDELPAAALPGRHVRAEGRRAPPVPRPPPARRARRSRSRSARPQHVDWEGNGNGSHLLAAGGARSRARAGASSTRQRSCGDLDDYRAYIESSKGEWSVAKNGYVAGRPGWFSCRSACYLAAGRPVVVQDTGFGDVLPTGEGILAFSDETEAADALDDVESRYAVHAACRARARRRVLRLGRRAHAARRGGGLTGMARVLLSSWMVRYPLGGNLSWALQWLVGLDRLGHDVYLVEDSGYPGSCYDPARDAMGDDCAYGAAVVDALLAGHGLHDRWCYRDAAGRYHGLGRERVEQALRVGRPVPRHGRAARGVARGGGGRGGARRRRDGARLHADQARARGRRGARRLRLPLLGRAEHRHPADDGPERRARVAARLQPGRDGAVRGRAAARRRRVHDGHELARARDRGVGRPVLRAEGRRARALRRPARPLGRAPRARGQRRDRAARAPPRPRLAAARRARGLALVPLVRRLHPRVGRRVRRLQGGLRRHAERVVQRPQRRVPRERAPRRPPGHRLRRAPSRAARASSPSPRPRRRPRQSRGSRASPTRHAAAARAIAREHLDASVVLPRLLEEVGVG